MNLLPARFAVHSKPSDAAGTPRGVYLCAALLAAAAAAALAIDVPVAGYVLRNHESGPLETAVDLLSQVEPFAHAAGVVVLLIGVRILDPARRRRLLRVAVCAFGSGLLADVVKMIVMRRRPKAALDVTGVWETFEGWLPLLGDISSATERAIQSFPSGHAATAAGLAVALSWLYPHGRWLFVSLAVLSSLQRVVAAAHFPSDVLAGAALGCLVAGLILDPRVFGRHFTRFETRGKRLAQVE